MNKTGREAWDRRLRVRDASRTVRKRCPRCNKVGWYKSANQRCLYLVGMFGSFTCGGHLETVLSTARKALTPQERAAVELADAKRRITIKVRALVRLTKSLAEWEARARRLARLVTMTDAELAMMREKAQAAAAKGKAACRIRGMKVRTDA